MKPSRLRAPSTDGALLAVPPLGDAGRALDENRARLTGWEYDFQGRSASVLRDRARAEAISYARGFMERHGLTVPEIRTPQDDGQENSISWVVTGHQPELFHPGVWVKNFATAEIARAVRGVSLNLIVDNDLPKSASIRVPTHDQAGLRRVDVAYDSWTEREVPFEDLDSGDEALFGSFRDRVREVLGSAVEDPLIDDYWPHVLSQRGEVKNVGLRFAVARHRVESEWGYSNLELPLSLLCQSDAFLWFFSHVIAHLPRFQEIHNSALADYRRLYGIRSRHHPVASLETRGEWREAPFWVWRSTNPRRQPLLVKQVGSTLHLRISGEDETLMELPLAPDREACCAVERLRELPERSIRIRTRALTTTMFARFVLSDLFLHGIGGAKYDELGDSIAARFFGITPPTFLTLSQTVWLGLPLEDASRERLDQVRHLMRDSEFNPERLLHEPIPPAARSLLDRKQEVISGPQETRRQRKARWRELRRITESLRPFVGLTYEQLREQLSAVEHGLERNQIAKNREYSLVLHSISKLKNTMTWLGGHSLVSGSL